MFSGHGVRARPDAPDLHHPPPNAGRVVKKTALADRHVLPPERAVGSRFTLDAVAQHGESTLELPFGPPFLQFSDDAVLSEALGDAGFEQVAISEFQQDWPHETPRGLIAAYKEGTAPARRRAIHEGISAACQPYLQADGPLLIPMPCVLASATKP